MSSAILYFAIVAIWAGILMPRWLRPSARHRAEDAHPGAAASEAAAPEAAAPEAAAPEAMAPEGVAAFAQPGLDAGDRDQAAALEAEVRKRAAALAAEERKRAAAREAEDRKRAALDAETAAARRANVLRARRRMLSTLVVLTLGALGIAVSRIAAWWVIVPPGVLLAGFLLLLREAARSDAARARRHAHDAEARQRRQPPAAPPDEPEVFERIASTPEAPQPEAEPTPSAEIIDISARVNDQVYDQYTDAAERAVGD